MSSLECSASKPASFSSASSAGSSLDLIGVAKAPSNLFFIASLPAALVKDAKPTGKGSGVRPVGLGLAMLKNWETFQKPRVHPDVSKR